MINAVGDQAIEPQRKEARGLSVVVHGVGELTQPGSPRRRHRRRRPGLLFGHDDNASQALRGIERIRSKAFEQKTARQGRRGLGSGLKGGDVEGSEQGR